MNLNYYIYYIIEDSVKEVLNGTEVLLHLFYNGNSVKMVVYGPEVLHHIIEDSVQEVLYGPGVLLHLLYHRSFY